MGGEESVAYAIPIGLELTGMLLLVLGLAVELATGADIWHTLVSAGSVLITLGSVVWGKLLRRKKKAS